MGRVVAALLTCTAVGIMLAAYPSTSEASEPVVASWYGPGFEGNVTASGRIFDSREFVAAHKTLPFGTRLKVTYRGRLAALPRHERRRGGPPLAPA